MKVKAAVFIIVGIVVIGLSVVCFSWESGWGESSRRYDGDANTGIRQSAAQKPSHVAIALKAGLSYILFQAGASAIFLGILFEVNRKKKVATSEKAGADIKSQNSNQPAPDSDDNTNQLS